MSLSPSGRSMTRRGLFRSLAGLGRDDDPDRALFAADPALLEADRLLAAGCHAEAATHYAARLAERPDHLLAGRKLGYCALRLNQPERARQAWQQVLNNRPHDRYALLYSAVSHLLEQRLDRALEICSRFDDPGQVDLQRLIHSARRRHAAGKAIDCAVLAGRFEALIAAADLP
jgi:tetratricopeptide (TPR) repeat protein